LSKISITGYNWSGVGIYLDYSVNVWFDQCMVRRLDKGVQMSSTAHPTAGHYCEGVLICNSLILQTNYGVYNQAGSANGVRGCIIDFAHAYGVHSTGLRMQITDSYIAVDSSGGGMGAYINGGIANVVGNAFVAYSTKVDTGIQLVTAGVNIVTGNQFNGWDTAIDLDSFQNAISGNTFQDLDWGIDVSGDRNAITGNTFVTITSGNDAIILQSTADYNTVVGNVCDEGITDNGNFNEVAHNTIFAI